MFTLEFGKKTKFCWICGKDIALEHCKTDKHGLTVHQSCDAKRGMSKFASQQAEARRNADPNRAA